MYGMLGGAFCCMIMYYKEGDDYHFVVYSQTGSGVRSDTRPLRVTNSTSTANDSPHS